MKIARFHDTPGAMPSVTGEGAIHYDDATKKLRVSVDAAAYADLATGPGTANFRGAFATAGRPDPATLSPGDWIFNTTTNAPEWSNGTAYFDATGTPT